MEHFEPKSLALALRLDYFNLVYSCRRCNHVKLDQPVADPLTTLSSDCATVLPDGRISSERIDTLPPHPATRLELA
ncbi:MAG: hypothetical protein R3C56_09290 [Pirellulaceae bacterium]